MKVVLVGAAAALVVVSGLQHDGASRAAHSAAATQVVRQVLDQTQPDARCTRLGAPNAVAARNATALVRRPGGTLAVVSFRDAWAVYTGEKPGTFVSLCLGRARTAS